MRSARAQDYWKRIYKVPCQNSFVEFDLNGLNRIGKIEAPKGLWAICGLNGAGKSTIISAVKDIIGIPLSEYDNHKLGTIQVQAIFNNNGDQINCSNVAGQRLVDHGWSLDKICYLDCARNAAIQDYLISQPDLSDILDQYEELDLSENDILELNHIVGKRYDSCSFRLLEDVSADGNILYCRVSVGDIEYDSRGMGSGEHFLFYLFWSLKSIEKGSILIIEEPETYISILSQERLLNYLAKQIAEKNLTVILTTHSPYILKQIRSENIRIVSRMGNTVRISTPNETLSAEDVLGMKSENKGTFFVEDRVAADFLAVCLEDFAPEYLRDYSIDVVGGEAEITSRLKFPRSDKIKYNFVGIYDGDMRPSIAAGSLNWNHCFLPGEKPIEAVFQKFVEQENGIEKLSISLQKEPDMIFHCLSALEGTDYHDWFEEFRKTLGIDGKALVKSFYNVMKGDCLDIETFLKELSQCL